MPTIHQMDLMQLRGSTMPMWKDYQSLTDPLGSTFGRMQQEYLKIIILIVTVHVQLVQEGHLRHL